jgi:hypothetical protein
MAICIVDKKNCAAFIEAPIVYFEVSELFNFPFKAPPLIEKLRAGKDGILIVLDNNLFNFILFCLIQML